MLSRILNHKRDVPAGPFQAARDGIRRVHDVGTDKLWLIFGGECHHVASTAVYNALFKPKLETPKINSITSLGVSQGFSLGEGTRLVRPLYGDIAYVLTEVKADAALLSIPNRSTADRYGFDLSLATELPAFLIRSLRIKCCLA